MRDLQIERMLRQFKISGRVENSHRDRVRADDPAGQKRWETP
jgi:hypothetical protein